MNAVGAYLPLESGRETNMFRLWVLLLAASFLPAVVGGSDTSGTDARTLLCGRVCTPEGTSVPGIVVECLVFDPRRESEPLSPVGRQVSDEDGRYEFQVQDAREYYIRILIAAREPMYVRSKSVIARPGARTDIEDLMVRPGASLKGRIVSSEGTPVTSMEFAYMSGAERFSPFRPLEYPKTNATGLFYVGSLLPDEEVAFWAVVDASQIQVWTGIPPTAPFLELRLNPREYVEMPPQWKVYSDAEAFVRQTVGTRIQKRIDFTLPDLAGRQVSLSSGRFKGKVVLVNIFGSWCGGCRIEIPYLVRLNEKYAAQGLEVIGLAFERESGEAGKTELRTFLQEAKVNYTVLFGGPTKAEHVMATIKGVDRFCGYPTTILLGRDGKVKHTEVGVNAETKERTDWWSRRFEKKVIDLLSNAPER